MFGSVEILFSLINFAVLFRSFLFYRFVVVRSKSLWAGLSKAFAFVIMNFLLNFSYQCEK